MRLFGRARATLAASAMLVACSSGGFEDHVGGAAGATLRATALDPIGKPKPDVDLYRLATIDAADRLCRSDSRGELRADGVAPGPQRLVLNDGSGHAALVEPTLFAGGENDLGEVTLAPVGELPQLVTLHGVGFEERLTTARADAAALAVASGGAQAYLLRRRGLDPAPTLREVDLGTATERVLDLAPPRSEREGEYGLRLLSPTLLLWSEPESAEDDVRSAVIVDPAAGRRLELSTTATVEAVWAEGRTAWAEIRGAPDSIGARTASLLRWDPALPEPVAAPLAGGRPFDAYALFARRGAWVAYAPSRRCDAASSVCTSDEAAGRSELRLLTTADPTGERLVSVDARWFGPRTSPLLELGSALPALHFVKGLDAVLRQVDFVTGTASTRSVLLPAPSDTLLALWHADDTSLLASASVAGVARLVRVPKAGGPAAVFYPRVEIDRSWEFLQCHPASCHVDVREDGSIRVIADLESSSGIRRTFGVIAELDADGRLRSGRVLPHGTRGLVSSSAGFDALTGFDPFSGWQQLFLTAPDAPLRQLTWLSSNHLRPAFSADGTWVYYLARDPLSGYMQLFRRSTRDDG